MSKNIAEQVIDAFGGLTGTSKALGDVPVPTVQGWKITGRIPRWRRQPIIEAAHREGVQLPPEFEREGAH